MLTFQIPNFGFPEFFSSYTWHVLLHFSLSVKAVTLIFISGRDLAISSTHEGKQVILTVKQKILIVC